MMHKAIEETGGDWVEDGGGQGLANYDSFPDGIYAKDLKRTCHLFRDLMSSYLEVLFRIFLSSCRPVFIFYSIL